MFKLNNNKSSKKNVTVFFLICLNLFCSPLFFCRAKKFFFSLDKNINKSCAQNRVFQWSTRLKESDIDPYKSFSKKQVWVILPVLGWSIQHNIANPGPFRAKKIVRDLIVQHRKNLFRRYQLLEALSFPMLAFRTETFIYYFYCSSLFLWDSFLTLPCHFVWPLYISRRFLVHGVHFWHLGLRLNVIRLAYWCDLWHVWTSAVCM